MVVVMVERTGGCRTSSLAGRSKVGRGGGGVKDPLALAKRSLSLSPNRLKQGNKKRKEKKK